MDKLKEICTAKRDHVKRLKVQKSFSTIDIEARNFPSPRDFAAALHNKIEKGDIGLIAEIKKASPSAGVIRSDFDPAAIAKAYETGGAVCLSVLTDAPYFQGTNEDLIAAREACNLPILRKDFIIDPWQVAEARAIGADCILLIMAAVDDSLAAELHSAAISYNLEVLIEIHDRIELERALKLPSGLIGINNRNLKTMKVDINTTIEIAPLIPNDRLIVSESGIKTQDNIQHIRNAGVHCFLIGEYLLKSNDITMAVKSLSY